MYTATVLEQFHNPHNLGLFENPDVLGRAGMPGEGPYMGIALCLVDGRIAAASFESYGCPSAIACGSWLTRWVEGKTFEQALMISAEDLMRVLGGLPLGKEHAAHLAIKALRDALRQIATDAEASGCMQEGANP
jgi:NifU-like protein involved in Fe-S cluster formation